MRLRRVRNCGVKSCKAIFLILDLRFTITITIYEFGRVTFYLPNHKSKIINQNSNRPSARRTVRAPVHRSRLRLIPGAENHQPFVFSKRQLPRAVSPRTEIISRTTSVTGFPFVNSQPRDNSPRKFSHHLRCRKSRPVSGLLSSSRFRPEHQRPRQARAFAPSCG